LGWGGGVRTSRAGVPRRTRGPGCACRDVRDFVTTARTGSGGRYRPGRKRRLSTALFTLLAAAIAATLLVALGARTISARATCTGQTTTAQVAVSAEIAPAIQRLATFFNTEHRQVDGRCAAVTVRTVPAATVA